MLPLSFPEDILADPDAERSEEEAVSGRNTGSRCEEVSTLKYSFGICEARMQWVNCGIFGCRQPYFTWDRIEDPQNPLERAR